MNITWNLPPTVLAETFKKLSLSDLAICSRVCKAWNRVTECEVVWAHRCFDLNTVKKDPFLTSKQWAEMFLTTNGFTHVLISLEKIILTWEKNIFIESILKFPKCGIELPETTESSHEENILTCHFEAREYKCRIFTGSMDKTIKIWEKTHTAYRLMERQTLHGHEGVVTTLSSTRDFLFSGSTDRTIKVWAYNEDTSQYTLHQSLEGHQGGITAVFANANPRFNCFFSGSKDRAIVFWRKVNGIYAFDQVLKGHESEITCLTKSENDNQLYSGDANGIIKIWFKPARQWECIHTIKAHQAPIANIYYDQFRGRFLSSAAKEAKCWKRYEKQWGECGEPLIEKSPILMLKIGHAHAHQNIPRVYVLTKSYVCISMLSENGFAPSESYLKPGKAV